jgi:hypothetical protein
LAKLYLVNSFSIIRYLVNNTPYFDFVWHMYIPDYKRAYYLVCALLRWAKFLRSQQSHSIGKGHVKPLHKPPYWGGAIDLNTKLRKTLNGGNLTQRVLTGEHWYYMLNKGA